MLMPGLVFVKFHWTFWVSSPRLRNYSLTVMDWSHMNVIVIIELHCLFTKWRWILMPINSKCPLNLLDGPNCCCWEGVVVCCHFVISNENCLFVSELELTKKSRGSPKSWDRSGGREFVSTRLHAAHHLPVEPGQSAKQHLVRTPAPDISQPAAPTSGIFISESLPVAGEDLCANTGM